MAIGRRDDGICPYRLLKRYMKRWPAASNSPLFPSNPSRTTALTDGGWVSITKKAAAQIGRDPALYAGHSWRAGGCTFYYLNDADIAAIQKLGRWEGETWKLYRRIKFADTAALATLDIVGGSARAAGGKGRARKAHPRATLSA